MRTTTAMAASRQARGAGRRARTGRGGRGLLRAATAAGAAATILAGIPALAAPATAAATAATRTGAAGTVTAASAGSASAGMLGQTYQAAAEIADNLNSLSWPGQAGYNTYQTGTQSTSVVWGTPGSPTTYFNRSKCASFVTQLLKREWPWATDQYFTRWFGSTSPTAAQYHDTFTVGAQYFTTSARPDLDQVTEIAAGVIMAIKYTASSPGTGDPTGHVMIVAGHPVRHDRDGDASTVEWAIPVIDTTSNPHGVANTSPSSPYQGFRDSRAAGATENPGVGRGWIFVRTDAANRPQGHWWGANENLTTGYHPVAARPISFGWVGY